MSKHTFEIRQREANEHRGPKDGKLGHLGIVIDGVEAEYTNDPMDAWPTCLKQALEEGLAPGGPAEQRALELCEERSRHCLERVIEHIRAGSLVPGGIPLGAKGLDFSPIKKPKRRDEGAAVEAFLNRGNLKGLTADERKTRARRRNEQRDHAAEWLARRGKLLADRQKDLAGLEEKAKADPGKAAKYARSIELLRDEIALLSPRVVAASHGFQYAYGQYLKKAVDLVNDDIRIVPCMTNTTVDTQ